MKISYIIVSILFLLGLSGCNDKNLSVSSPDGCISLCIALDDEGVMTYQVGHDGKVVLKPSRLGFILKEVPNLADNFEIIGTTTDSKDETWQPVWGEENVIVNNYNELRVRLRQKDELKRRMDVVFRVFDDGIGFRYEFPRQENLQDFVILEELTEFAMPADHEAWSIPADGPRFYEALFERCPLSKLGWASTPVTIETTDSLYLTIHEANLTDYAAMNLKPGDKAGKEGVTLHAELTPWSNGDRVRVTDVRQSPWRTLIIADRPGDLILSRLMLNLNEPCKIEDTSWIKPMRYIGIWWDYHMKNSTWEAGPRHGATTENTKRYMDFAAANGFGGVLVEGWNHDWATWNFSFTKPYDDFDLKAITDYGRGIGVALIGHHETGGRVANYESQMEDGMALYQKYGMHYVKTGYVGDFLQTGDPDPKKANERHSSQYGVRHYRKVIEAAARHQLCIDNHEPVIPTGLQRTYPNLMTQEGVRGQEWDAWCPAGGNPPSHTATLPFTRGLAGPMDFTPVTFSFENPVMPQTRVMTTLAKQLAEFVVLYSPLQMASDRIENYQANPEPFSFVTSCPTDWSKTVVPEAKIGEYVTIARRDKQSDNWFVGALTNENARTAHIVLDFLEPGASYTATIYRDGDKADFETNPTDIVIESRQVTAADTLDIKLARSGGAAIRIEKK